MTEVTKLADFERLRSEGRGYFVIIDPSTASHAHVHDVNCCFVREDYFVRRTMAGPYQMGRYYWICGPEEFDDRIEVDLCTGCL